MIQQYGKTEKERNENQNSPFLCFTYSTFSTNHINIRTVFHI